jgi:hypothetical protein
MSVFNSPIDSKIAGSLERRQTLMGKKSRTPQELTFLNSNTSFIRLSSSVNIDGKSDLAKANVLAGGLLTSNRPHAGIGRDSSFAYSPINSDGSVNLLGVRPMPGITSVSIDNIGAYGSTRKATVNFQCWDVKQLEILEKLYMRPGYTVLLEFGRNLFLKDNGSIQPVIPKNDFFGDVDVNLLDYLNKLYKKSIEFEGNYDAFFGYIVNYSWTSRNDGGYDCKTEILSTGEVVESLKANYSAAGAISFGNVSSFKGFFANKYSYNLDAAISQKMSEEYSSNIVSGLCTELYHLINANVFQNITGNNGTRQIKVTVDGTDIDIDYTVSFHESKEQTPGELIFLDASKQNNYVTLESFCKLFTAIVIPNTYSSKINSDGSKTKTGKLFEITTKNRGYLEQSNEDLLCLFNNYMTSVNPDVCLIKNPRWLNILTQNNISVNIKPISSDVTNDPEITTGIQKIMAGWVQEIVDASNVNVAFTPPLDDLFKKIDEAYKNSGKTEAEYTKILMKNYQSLRGGIETVNEVIEGEKDPKVYKNRLWSVFKAVGGAASTVTILRKNFENKDKTLGDLTSGLKLSSEYTRLRAILSNDSYVDVKLDEALQKQSEIIKEAVGAKNEVNTALTNLQNSAEGYRKEQTAMIKDFKLQSSSGPSFGIIGNIYVNLKFLHKLANDPSLFAQDKNGKNNLSAVSYFNALLKPIQTSLGNVNTFELYGDPVDGIVRIVDLNYVNKDADKNIFEFEVGSNESIIRDLKFEAQISSEMSSMIAISAQSDAGKTGLDNSTLVAFNKGIEDRMIPKKDSPMVGSNNDKAQFSNFISSLSVLANKFFKPYFGGMQTKTATFVASEYESYSNALRDIMAFISSVRTTDNKGKSFLPLKLSMTLDGISGLIIGNLFKVNQKFIPKYYTRDDGKLGYTIIKIDQQIQNNDWTTQIQAYPFNIDSSGNNIKIDDSVPFDLIINYNANASGSSDVKGGGDDIRDIISTPSKEGLEAYLKRLNTIYNSKYSSTKHGPALEFQTDFTDDLKTIFNSLATSPVSSYPLFISSGVRSKDDPLSKANPKSKHIQGLATDIQLGEQTITLPNKTQKVLKSVGEGNYPKWKLKKAYWEVPPKIIADNYGPDQMKRILDIEQYLVKTFNGVTAAKSSRKKGEPDAKHEWILTVNGRKIRFINEHLEWKEHSSGPHFHFQREK